MLNKFFNCRKQLFFLMFTIILIIYFNSSFIHKKRFHGSARRDCSGNHNFSWHLIGGRKQILIWNIRFLSFSLYMFHILVNRNVKGKNLFHLARLFFQSCRYSIQTFQLMLWCNRTSIATPIIHFGSFYLFELKKVSSFDHSSNWQMTDFSLFGNFTRC